MTIIILKGVHLSGPINFNNIFRKLNFNKFDLVEFLVRITVLEFKIKQKS